MLVHGAFGGDWCWRWVEPHLTAAGHEVHTADIVNALRYRGLTEVVLVGWSYDGIVVAGAADRTPECIAYLVYLDSDVPRGPTVHVVADSTEGATTTLENSDSTEWRDRFDVAPTAAIWEL